MKLNLIVLEAKNMDALAAFYTVLGCAFKKHRHGKGPEHYAYERDGVVFEIYPQRDGDAVTRKARIGFLVDSVDELLEKVRHLGSGNIVSDAKDTAWGRRGIIDDPEGNRIELTEKGAC